MKACVQVYRADDVMLTLQGLTKLGYDPGQAFLRDAAELLLALGKGCTPQVWSLPAADHPVSLIKHSCAGRDCLPSGLGCLWPRATCLTALAATDSC